MGNKVNPVGLRLGFAKNLGMSEDKYNSVWFDSKNYSQYIAEDIKIKNLIDELLEPEIFSKVKIFRVNKKINLKIVTHKPGILIGKQGSEIIKLKQKIEKKIQKEVNIQIEDLVKPELDVKIICCEIAKAISEGQDYKRIIRFYTEKCKAAGALGMQIRLSGRLKSLIAKTDKYSSGSLRRQTLSSNITHYSKQALCKYGVDGVQVTIRS